MSESQGDIRKYVFAGCAVIVLIPIVAVLTVVVRTWIPLRSAGTSQADLERRFGAAETFVPAPDGRIAPDRLEAFLAVRRSMMEICPKFESLEAALRHMDQKMNEEDPPSGREIIDVASTFVGALGDLTPLVGEFFQQRNHALMEVGMGIGEYAYIFTMAYGGRLTEDDVKRMLFADGVSFSPETGAALRSMLVHQRKGLSTEENAGDLRAALAREISALEEEPGRVPWQDRLLDPIQRSLMPYREQLDLQFCPQTAGMATDPDPDRAMVIALE